MSTGWEPWIRCSSSASRSLTRTVARVKAALSQTNLHSLYMPGDAPANAFGELMKSPDPAVFWRNYSYNVAPVTMTGRFSFTPCSRAISCSS